MRALLCSIVLLASTASADKMRMKVVESTNLHMANQAGARHWTEDYEIGVLLGAKGKASVTSKGMHSNHDMTMMNNTPYNTEDSATWTTTWRGTWIIKGDVLSLELDLVKHDCKGEQDENGRKTVAPCKTASAKATLTCASQVIDVENRTSGKTAKSAAWMCSPAATGTELAESTGPWVFAKGGCVEVRGGHMTANTFARCP